MEKEREESRVACGEIIIAKTGNSAIIARMFDTSLKGALIRFTDDTAINIGDECLITLKLKNSGIFIKIRSEVVYTQANHAGVRFVHMDTNTLMLLHSHLEVRNTESSRIFDGDSMPVKLRQ